MGRRVKRQLATDNVDEFTPAVVQHRQRYKSRPRNQRQVEYLEKLQDSSKDIVIAIGPAGTGKTLLGVQHGIQMLQDRQVSRIVVTRPAVSVDEDIGFLPGSLNEKMAPWTKPVIDIFLEYYQARNVNRMLEEGIVEISPLAYMRGRTFHDSYIVFDEAQLSTSNQMLMVLTRIGDNSRLVVTGDLNQSDRGINNGLQDFVNRLKISTSSRIELVQFGINDVERHPVVQDILDMYRS